MKWKPYILLLLLVFSISACEENIPSQQSGQGDNKPKEGAADNPDYERYASPITMTIGFKIPDSGLNTGDSNDNNPVSRYLESITNIKVKHYWEAKGADAYFQKVELAIDSNDMPDAMVVDLNQLWKLADNNMIEDLTKSYADYGSDLIKEIYDSTKGRALTEATRDGRLYGLPNVAIHADSPSLLWVRQDWLDKLNLQPPQTFSDIENIARAFIEQDPDGNRKRDTVGLSGYKDIVYATKPHINGFDTIFSAFHAFPKNWIMSSSGQVQYGSISMETKEALAKLADWYKRGLIDKQFALNKETQEPIIEGRSGMFFGPWWMPYYPLSEAVAVDTKAEWRAYAVPLDDSGKFVTHMAPVTDRYLVVRKGYEHPGAVIKLLNAFTRLERRQDPNQLEVRKMDDFSAQTGIQPRAYYPFDLLLDYSDAIERHYTDIQQAIHGKLDPQTLDPDTKKIYDQWMAEKEYPKKNLEGWKVANAYEYGVGVLVDTPMDEVHGIFYGTTPTMEKKWADLEKLESETFLSIVVGDLPVSAFDDFVIEWKSQGGDTITREVTDKVNHQWDQTNK